MSGHIPRDLLQSFLDGLVDVGYAFAKNPDIWRSLERGGDWDVVVADLGGGEDWLIQTLGPPLTCVRRSYVRSYFFEWGSIDLLPDLRWRGVILVPGRAVVGQAGFGMDRRTRIARPAHQAIAGWMAPLLAWGGYRSRYESVVAEAERSDGNELRKILVRTFGQERGARVLELARGEHVSPAVVARLRRSALFVSTTYDPLSTLGRHAHFVYREVVARTQLRLSTSHRSTTPEPV